MRPRGSLTTKIVLAVVTVAGVVVMGGVADADPAGITLQYRCSMPLFPEQPMTVRLTWNAPKSVPVNRNTPIVPFNAVATMGADVTQGLHLVGAATLEGSADATGVVAAPEGNADVHVPLTVPRKAVPASGPVTVVASGKTPVLVFHRPGHATITVGSGFAVHLSPKTAEGGPAGIDRVDASCTLDPGQDTVLTSFGITAPRANPAPAPGRPTGPTAAAGSTAPGTRGTVAAGRHGSAAAQAPATAPSSGVSVAGDTSTAATHGTAFPTVSTTGLAAVVAPWLIGGVLLVVGAVLGCVWWLRRRHRRGQGHPGSL
jgi:hypothetical protein